MRGPAPKLCRLIPGLKLGVKGRARTIAVPHKQPSNDTFELHWKFGRYICQLKRLTFNFCSKGGSSRGLRHFLDFEVNFFISKNPQVSVYIRERNGQHPRLVANYLNGKDRIITIPNHDTLAIWEWLERLRNESGRQWRSERLYQPWITDSPSIQGTWTPFLNKPPLNVNELSYLTEDKKEQEMNNDS
ncbi:39S ribosomal protein L43, mitochondrial-like isoform X2 [Hydractinia symbiolongicarpus]|nr:39S ribosomal protein L43, mitochondrial-like isoform X2 [Hydractinia symbiolongicarpus]XP_057306774.1 39S ribosomal protein L43, mitochondrial-like isoform X2 [Hydractinia symbiolongicarpus]XP_057306775.1 39S ribosomal protein L43, mitochondrial-like isoform X2 [Hydractinia symbiolongicarpus]